MLYYYYIKMLTGFIICTVFTYNFSGSLTGNLDLMDLTGMVQQCSYTPVYPIDQPKTNTPKQKKKSKRTASLLDGIRKVYWKPSITTWNAF